MNPVERRKIAWNYRQEGKTYREIGEIFGFGVNRARQLVEAHERRINTRYENILIKEFHELKSPHFIRGINSLIKHFGSIEAVDPHEIASMGFKELLKLRNMGKKTATDIAIALANLGIIEDADDFISFKANRS